ncbi:2-oxo acid dehydrogenase subunit E2, partial [Staphylococcus epidermidis]|uniref:2-oxo acid dehydrogenase subunit E2 n=1 Tax=Staphylococcus epidermidis TaxID=1282 RepID=UPI0037D9CF19
MTKPIPQNILTTLTQIPHASIILQPHPTNFLHTTNYHKPQFKHNHAYNLTFFPFFLKPLPHPLKLNPLLNTTSQPHQILIHKHINISIPLPHHHKFYLPLIKNPHQKSIKPIPPEINHLATKPRLPK